MEFIEAIVLGIIQALTEYFPVSSTMHLLMVQKILGWESDPNKILIFNSFVQFGTLFAVVNFFFIDIYVIKQSIFNRIRNRIFDNSTSDKMLCLIAAATIPAVLVGFVFKSCLESYFVKQSTSVYFLYITSLILLISVQFSTENKDSINLSTALAVGCAQAFALIPGISRSGITVSVALLLGLHKSDAIKFSFLMSIPIILAANFFTLFYLYLNSDLTPDSALSMFVSFFVAAFLGNTVISFSIRFLKYCNLQWFGIYCAVVATFFLYFK